MRKWMPAVLIAIAFVASALTLPRLPEMVAPDLGALLPFETTSSEPASRAFMAFVLPATALGIWLLFLTLTSGPGLALENKLFGRWAPAHTLEREAIDRFRPTFDLVVVAVIAFILSFHAMVLVLAAGGPSWIVHLFAFTIGLGLAVIGNVMPRTRANPIMGLRTRATLNDPILWARMHRLFGGLLVAAGVLVMLLAIIALRYALLAMVSGLLVSCLVVLIALLRSPRTAATGVVVAVLLLLGNGVTAQVPARPDSIPSTAIREEARSFKSGDLILEGTLATPARMAGQVPVVVIVVGSGATDRNGNGPGAQTNLYRQLAWQLAERGIASFRYDKRGIGAAGMKFDSAQIAKRLQQLVIGDYVGDVMEAAHMVDADTRFGDVFLLGHSEGAQLVLQASNRGAPAAGVIMASGMGRPLRDVLHDQFALQFPAAEVMRLDSAFVKYLAGEDVTGIPPGPLQALFYPLHRNLIRSMAAYDPVAEIRRANKPLLLVHGGMDVQTTQADAQPLRAARPTAAVLDIPNANHVFKAVTSLDLSVQRPTYMNAALPIVPELALGIADWILKR
jgi:uncharacterized protein